MYNERIIEFTKYREENGISYVDKYEARGWSLTGEGEIYLVETTKYTIAQGVLSVSESWRYKDGSPYKYKSYKSYNGGGRRIRE